jgi:hypothetical protein
MDKLPGGAVSMSAVLPAYQIGGVRDAQRAAATMGIVSLSCNTTSQGFFFGLGGRFTFFSFSASSVSQSMSVLNSFALLTDVSCP